MILIDKSKFYGKAINATSAENEKYLVIASDKQDLRKEGENSTSADDNKKIVNAKETAPIEMRNPD